MVEMKETMKDESIETAGQKQTRWRIGLLSTAFVATIMLSGENANATLINATMTNPGAEGGSTTGWYNYSNWFTAVNNHSQAYEGDWYFFQQCFQGYRKWC